MINFYFSDEYVNHDTGSHPESIQRIKTVKQLLNNKYTKHHFIEPSKASTELISNVHDKQYICLLYTSPSPRDMRRSRMPSSA